MYNFLLLSFVLCTLRSVLVARVCCANLQPASKLLVAMDLSSSSMIPFLVCSSINIGHLPASPLPSGFVRCVWFFLQVLEPFIVGRLIVIVRIVSLFIQIVASPSSFLVIV